MTHYKVVATQLNRLTRDSMGEKRAEDREVEYLEQGAIVDDFTDREVKRYTSGSHPSIVECDADGNLTGDGAPVRVVAFSSDPIPGAVEELDADAVAAGSRELDGALINLADDRTPPTDSTLPVGAGPDQSPADGSAAKPKATKTTKAPIVKGAVAGGNIGEADASEDAPSF